MEDGRPTTTSEGKTGQAAILQMTAYFGEAGTTTSGRLPALGSLGDNLALPIHCAWIKFLPS